MVPWGRPLSVLWSDLGTVALLFLGYCILLDEWSLLQPQVAGLYLQPWAEGPTPATYFSSLWGSSISLEMGMVGWALRSPGVVWGVLRSSSSVGPAGLPDGAGHEVAVGCKEIAWWLSALHSDGSVITQGREPSACTEKWRALISLLQSQQVSFLLVHRRMQQRHMCLQATRRCQSLQSQQMKNDSSLFVPFPLQWAGR